MLLVAINESGCDGHGTGGCSVGGDRASAGANGEGGGGLVSAGAVVVARWR